MLVIGSGGREHAIAWKLSESRFLSQVFVAPGNAGTEWTDKTENRPGKIVSHLPLLHCKIWCARGYRITELSSILPSPRGHDDWRLRSPLCTDFCRKEEYYQ